MRSIRFHSPSTKRKARFCSGRAATIRRSCNCRKHWKWNPNFSPALIWLSRAYALRGMVAEALAESQKDNQAQPGVAAMENLAMAYAAAGNKDAALGLVRELQARGQHEYVPTFDLSYVYVFLKQKEKAMEELEIASEKHDINVNSLKVDPLLDPLRTDPRFHELLKRANLGS